LEQSTINNDSNKYTHKRNPVGIVVVRAVGHPESNVNTDEIAVGTHYQLIIIVMCKEN